MIKCETIGELDRVVVNPVLTAETDTVNNSIITADGDVYLVANEFSGDDAYKEDVVIPAGEFLNGYLLKSLEGQKLVIDGKHINGGLTNIAVGDVLVPTEAGTLAEGTAAGVHLVVTDINVKLTEKAVKAKVVVAAAG